MSRYSRKCGDCGDEVGEINHAGRGDICDGCYENRGWLLTNRVSIGMAEFQEIQRSMAAHRGTAKRRIEKLKAGI